MKEIKVFIASTGTGAYLSKADALSKQLLKDVTVSFWKECFKLGETNIEVLEKAASDCDFCVVLLTAEDFTCKNGIYDFQPRDNLIYELGLFTGALGRRRAIGIIDSGLLPDLPSDLGGMVLEKLEIQSRGFAKNAQKKILAHILEHGPKVDKDKELGFLYRTTSIFTHPFLYPNLKMGALNKIKHRDSESFQYIDDVVNIIRASFEDYLSNCIPGVRQGNLYIGYQYYLGDGVEIDTNSVICECKDKSIKGEEVDGKFVMGISTKTSNLQEWQIGRVSPGYDLLGAPLSMCASVYQSKRQEYNPDTKNTIGGPANDETPGELSLYSCPILWAYEHEDECFGVLSISGSEPRMIDEDMKDRLNFSSMLISYVFSIYANNRAKESGTAQDFENARVGAKLKKIKNGNAFNLKAKMIRREIASHFEKKFIKEKIHRFDGNALIVY